jgi:hypothetical protein
LTVEGAQSFDIVNTLGQVVFSGNTVQQSLCSIHHLEKGMYIVRGVDTEGAVFAQKIVKQ